MAQKVLIVDDDPSILLSLDFLMKKAGYAVFIARDGAEALDILQREIPDCLVLDIMMPEVDGYEVLRQVKENAATSHIKVIMLSAKSRETDIQQAMELGADNYITKPFATKKLLEDIRLLITPWPKSHL
ncbi:MAG: response regulator [Sphingobacteriaceae bacterium]|nr:response regulator [Sphingobacteriaceae bacterium]